MKAIQTKYHGPSNVRGSRIIADDHDGNRVIVPYDYSKSGHHVHFVAVQALCRKMGWNGHVVCGGLSGGVYVWVFLDHAMSGAALNVQTAEPAAVTITDAPVSTLTGPAVSGGPTFKTLIQWGTEATREENPDAISEYEFKTQAELDAFMYGVDESSGWMEYEVKEKPRRRKMKTS